jgi:peptide/nickel transport system permease protein
VQFLFWLNDAIRGDLGISLRTNMPVADLLAQKLPVTLQLALMSMLIATIIGVPAGVIAAVREGSWIDYAASVIALAGLSIPNFCLGIMLILLVSIWLDWLPASGYVPPAENLWLSIKTMLMPAVVLGTALAATLMRHMRSAMLGVLSTDYVRTARAIGLRERTVVLKHALRNALTPVLTVAALLFGELMAGAVLTEQVFTIPGLGKLLVDAVFTRDYAVVQGVVLVTALGFILLSLLADVACVLLNPRLRTG